MTTTLPIPKGPIISASFFHEILAETVITLGGDQLIDRNVPTGSLAKPSGSFRGLSLPSTCDM